MTSRRLHRLLLFTLLIVTAFGVIPTMVEAWTAPPWIDKIALYIMVQKNMDKTGNFDPYVKQLEVVTEAAVKEQYDGKRKGMNRFLEMLEMKEGGISAEAAHHIFRTVVNEVPYAALLPLKSEDKLDPQEKALVDRMKRFAASVRDQEERAGDDGR